MIRNTVLLTESFFYALGNVPAVSLTQDLPPEQDADILLLGCGDARNVLFTCYADASRKIDVTCNDIEPGIHARNVLLYTLLMEDKENVNFERIWNIYYHLKLDEDSVDLLETQIQKLLDISESIKQWNNSTYGSSIRFCDERSLSLVRSYWTGYRSQGLSVSEKAQRQKKLQTVMTRAKDRRGKGVVLSDLRAVFPVINAEAIGDLSKVAEQWWERGTTPSSTASSQSATDLNPTFLYSPSELLTLHYGTSPIVGFPLSTAYVPIQKGSAFHVEQKGQSSPERLVDCAKGHFKQWASAFRRAIENKSVIRILCGDALAVCCTLRHCLLALPDRTTSLNLFSDNWTNSPLKLHDSDYVDDEIAAPLSFDVIDTSNLVDHLGPLNVITVASSLLKFSAASSLYTEMLLQYDSTLTDRLSAFFGVDIRTMSLLLGLVLPDLFTNVADSVEDDMILGKLGEMSNTRSKFGGATQARSRLRWRRSRGCPYVNVEAETFARLLNQVHDAMFDYENPEAVMNAFAVGGKTFLTKQSNPAYNRASFAMLLNVLRATVVSDWHRCVEYIYNHCFAFTSVASLKLNSAQDLVTQMHLYGVDNGKFPKPDAGDVAGAVLIPILPSFSSNDVPEQLCVTIRVPREKLGIFTGKKPSEIGCPALVVSFEGADPGDMWLNFFSSVQIAFGKWRRQNKQDDSYPYIEEDSSQLSGTSDLYASVFVPTLMLLQSKKSAPWAKCGLKITPQNTRVFNFLGPNLVFYRSKMNSKDVFVTRYMPAMSGLPAFAPDSKRKDKPPSAATTARLSQRGTKIDTVVQRLTVECPAAKAKLSNPSSAVAVKFKSPLKAFVSIAQCQEQIEFPVPVSLSKYKVRVARKSSYIEVETPLFDPLDEDGGAFMFPTFMTEAPGGINAPMPWTSSRVDLDAMPPIDLKDTGSLKWLDTHASQMFSERERLIRESKMMGADVRTDLKDGLFSIFLQFTGLQGMKCDSFGLYKKEGMASGVQTLIFPSCLRLDLVNHSVVLDAAIIPLTLAMFDDPKAVQFLQELTGIGLCSVNVSEGENRAWKAMMPALVERCRTAASWKHVSDCEYSQTGKVPLTRGLSKDGVSPICSCGIGKFPSGDYLAPQMKKLSKLSYMINRYGTRGAISLIYTVPYVEGCYLKERLNTLGGFDNFSGSSGTEDKCKKCGRNKRESNPAGEQRLLICSGCRKVSYCSKKCQKADWRKHKPVCSAA